MGYFDSFLFAIIRSLGITFSFAIAAEIVPHNVREFGQQLCKVLAIAAFFILKLVPFVIEILGLYGSMLAFGTICVTSGIFVKLYIPQTKGETYEELMKTFH